MLSSSVMQTSLVCIPVSGETVVIRQRPGALLGSSVCDAPVGGASRASAAPEGAKTKEKRQESSRPFIIDPEGMSSVSSAFSGFNAFASPP